MAKKAKVLGPVSRNEDDPKTKKSAQKPQLKIVRNNLGTMVIIFFGLFTDLYALLFNSYYAYKYSLFNLKILTGNERYNFLFSFIAFLSSIFSLLFQLAILSVSGLTMQKQKRLKTFPFLVFAIFKLILFLRFEHYSTFIGLLVINILLYVCMSHTAKNKLVRLYFKPFKQVVNYF